MKKYILASLLAGTCFLIGFLYQYHLPNIKTWVVVATESLSREYLPVRIFPRDVHVQLIPLRVRYDDLTVLTQKDAKKVVPKIELKSASFEVDLISLLRGSFELEKIYLDKPKLMVNIPYSKKQKDDLKIPRELLQQLLQMPISEIEINDMNLGLLVPQLKSQAEFSHVDLSVSRHEDYLRFYIDTPSVLMSQPSENLKAQFKFSTEAEIYDQQIKLVGINLASGPSYLQIKGTTDQGLHRLDQANIQLQTFSHFNLEPMQQWLLNTINLKGIPELSGTLSLGSEFQLKGTELKSSDFKIKSQKLKVGNMTIGSVIGTAKHIKDTIKIPRVSIRSSAGEAIIENLSLKHKQKWPFTAKISSKSYELGRLLSNLGVKGVPIHINMTPKLDCGGQIKSGFHLKCQGTVVGSKLWVHSDMTFTPKNKIVQVEEFLVDGEVEVSNEAVSYDAKLTIGESKGLSKGVIDYAKGFKINYETEKLNFKDIDHLAGLKFAGSTPVKGSIHGDSSFAQFSMDLNPRKFWFEDYYLGTLKTRLSYRSGVLSFPNVKGFIGASRYNGQVSVNLRKESLNIRMRAPYIEANNLQSSFSRKVELPFKVTGSGSAQVSVSGPFEFTRLNYNLESTLYRGSIAGESFDQAHFNVESKKGHVVSDRIQVIKGNSNITLTGKGFPDGKIDTLITGTNLRLEQSELASKLGLELTGKLGFRMKLKGPVLNPDTELQGQVSEMTMGGRQLESSNFKLKFKPTSVEGQANLIGSTLETDFIIPLTKEAPFKLSFVTNGWDFTPLFAVAPGGATYRDFKATVSSKGDLYSKHGFWNMTGDIVVSEFKLNKGPHQLIAPSPILILFKDGIMNTKNFILQGDQTQLEVIAKNSSAKNFNVAVNGKIAMTYLTLPLAFFEELRGQLALSLKLGGNLDRLEVLGSSYIDDAYVKFKDFPHAFEAIKADLLFSQSKLFVNSLKGRLGGGEFLGDGNMTFKGIKNIPTKIKLSFNDVTLNVPDKVSSSGSGEVFWTGNWFPFTLSGTYNVSKGRITREVDEGSDTQSIRISSFLPPVLLRDQLEPFILDLNVNLNRNVLIENSLIEGNILGQLKLKGSPGSPIIQGHLEALKDGIIYFRNTQFEIATANVELKEGQEDNPAIYINGTSRVKEYDVTLTIQGTAKKPEISLSSQPELSDEDIISLLALGLTTEDLEQSSGSDEQVAHSMQIIAESIFDQTFGGELANRGLKVKLSSTDDSETATIDTVSLTYQFNDRTEALFGRTFSKNPKTDVKFKYRLSDKWSLLGTWEQSEFEESTDLQEEGSDEASNVFGLDFQYKMEFKFK